MEASGFDYAAEESGDSGISLTGGSVNDCVDVSSVGSGPWYVDVEVIEGTLRGLIIRPWDTWVPGDLCDEWKSRKNLPIETPIVLDVPGDYVNACGTEYADMSVDGVYYAHADPDIPSPIAVMVYTRGSSDLVVDLSVDVAPRHP